MRRLSDGRQRRSREEWVEIIDRFARSGLSENAFCKKAGLNRKTLRAWRQRLSAASSPPPAFVELVLPKSEGNAMPETLASGVFEMQLPGGVSLRWKP